MEGISRIIDIVEDYACVVHFVEHWNLWVQGAADKPIVPSLHDALVMDMLGHILEQTKKE